MSGSNRGIFVAGVGIIAATFLWFLITDLNSVSGSVEHRAADAARHYAADADEQVRSRCTALATPDRSKCVRETDQAARENQRVEFDLAAQQVTAWWTKVMGVAALIGMALSAIGVLLVWTTFAETKKANEISERARLDAVDEAGRADADRRHEREVSEEKERRALTRAESLDRAFIGLYQPQLQMGPFAHVYIKNFGRTPAYDLKADVKLVVRPIDALIGVGTPDEGIASRQLAPDEAFFRTHRIQVAVAPHAVVPASETDAFYILITCSYQDAFGQNHTYRACLVQTLEGLNPYPFVEA